LYGSLAAEFKKTKITDYHVNSAIHPSGVGKLSSGLWLWLRWGVFTCVKWHCVIQYGK